MSTTLALTCEYHHRGLCSSCTRLGVPYHDQVADKDAQVRRLLADVIRPDTWLAPALSPDRSFRNKAKLAVGGTRARPTLGLTRPDGRGVDLRECAIHERAIWEIIPDLAGFISLTGLAPYDVAQRRGDLKFVLVTVNPRGEFLLRFVVREVGHAQIVQQMVAKLLQRLPTVISVSANIHPEHRAVVEGHEEIQLYGPDFAEFPLAERTLLLRHRSFFQTNTDVAQQLYRQAALWADACRATEILDLYCGVGGFALHLAAPGRRVRGVEIEPAAVDAANAARAFLPDDCGDVEFYVGDATQSLTTSPTPDLVVVNPPRRGIGVDLCAALDTSGVRQVLYSSCNPTTLAQDLAQLPAYRTVHARLFDMFPQTTHSEVAVLLQRR